MPSEQNIFRFGDDIEVFHQRMLNSLIEKVEQVLYTFCQPAFLRYHNPEDRIGEIAQFRDVTFVAQPTHLQYSYQETVIEVPLIEWQATKDRLELFWYLAGPFFRFQSHTDQCPSRSACEKLRKCFESILRYEDAELLRAWARHIHILTPPLTAWGPNGDLKTYQFPHYHTAYPINLFQVFADGEEPRGFSSENWIIGREDILRCNPRWNPQHIDEPRSPAEGVKALTEQLKTTEPDEEMDAFIAEIDALMAEEDTDTPPPEGTLPKSAPTG